MFPLVISAVACINVASRSSLNVMDRFLFSRSKMGFFQLYFLTNIFPLVLGLLILPLCEVKVGFWECFWTWPCVLLALTAHLVGMSFSYAFRQCQVGQVVIKAKLPELIFASLSLIPFISNQFPLFSSDRKTYCVLVTTLLGLMLLGLQKKGKIASLFDRPGVYIIGSLVLQMLCCSLVPSSTPKALGEVFTLSVAMLLWRCCFVVPQLAAFTSYKVAQGVVVAEGLTAGTVGLLSCRAAVALLTQLTFTWCVLEGSPLLIWPIINSTPLISSLASQLILKEVPHWSEVGALVCFFLGSICATFL